MAHGSPHRHDLSCYNDYGELVCMHHLIAEGLWRNRAIKRVIKRLLAGGQRSLRFELNENTVGLVHHDSSSPGSWRMTYLSRAEVPEGHVGPCSFKEALEAIAEFCMDDAAVLESAQEIKRGR